VQEKDFNFPFIEPEIVLNFIHASGPGGQNVNKLATAVQLRFNVKSSHSINNHIKERLIKLAGKRMTLDGVLVIVAKRYRTQEQNRLDAEQKLKFLIVKAITPPKRRKPTKPTLASQTRRLETKKHRGLTKQLRTEIKNNG